MLAPLLLTQQPPKLPSGKKVEACSTQEKIEYLAQLHMYSDYLSAKLEYARESDGRTDIKPTGEESMPASRNVNISTQNEDVPSSVMTRRDDSIEDYYSSIDPAAPLLSLAPRSPFDTQPYRYLFQQQGRSDEPKRVRLWTEIGQANSLEVEQKAGQILVREKKPKINPEWCSSVEGASDSGDDCDGWTLSDVPGASPIGMQAQAPSVVPPRQRSPEREQMRDEAYDILSAASNKICQLEQFVFDNDDDEFVRNVASDVARMSARLSEYIEQAEAAEKAKSENRSTVRE